MPSPSLQLIDGGAQQGVSATLGIAPRPLPQLTRRPGDHLELHSFACGRPLAAIRAAAQRREFNAETAIALVVERSHITAEIQEVGAADLIEGLDRRSIEACASVELWSGHGSYLRHLLGLCPAPPECRPLRSPRVALPLRLIDRLGGADLELHEDPDVVLGVAIQWEIAALLAGGSMSEWAFRTLTRQLVGRES